MVSALAGIGGGVLVVPFLYVAYAASNLTLSAQTVVAHATSLGAVFVTSSVGASRYAAQRAIAWRHGLVYAIPGIVSAFFVARRMTHTESALWLRGAFGAFLLIIALDMAYRAGAAWRAPLAPRRNRALALLALVGALAGVLSALLGIGGGIIAVPALLYVGRLDVRAVAPTALIGVCLTTFAGAMGYLLSGPAPAISSWMVGYIDLRMAVPLSLGAIATVPFGVRLNRRSSQSALYQVFAGIFAVIGCLTLLGFLRGWG